MPDVFGNRNWKAKKRAVNSSGGLVKEKRY
jgi:hypothetical protein